MFFQEAVALQLTSLISTNSLKEDECQAHLLSDLQAEQKKETTYLLAGLLAKVTMPIPPILTAAMLEFC